MSLFTIFMFVAMAAVILSLVLGIAAMVRKGDAARKDSNRFMQWRLMAQAGAIIFFLLAIVSRG